MKSSDTNAERMPGRVCMAGGGGAQPAEGQPKVGEECRFEREGGSGGGREGRGLKSLSATRISWSGLPR